MKEKSIRVHGAYTSGCSTGSHFTVGTESTLIAVVGGRDAGLGLRALCIDGVKGLLSGPVARGQH